MNRVPIAVETDPAQCQVIQERVTNFINVILNPNIFVFNEDNSWPAIDEPLGNWYNVSVARTAEVGEGETATVTNYKGFPLGPWRIAHDINFTTEELEDCNVGEVDTPGLLLPRLVARSSYEGPRFAFYANTDIQREFEEGLTLAKVRFYFYVYKSFFILTIARVMFSPPSRHRRLKCCPRRRVCLWCRLLLCLLWPLPLP
jgi:hypothetical protein